MEIYNSTPISNQTIFKLISETSWGGIKKVLSWIPTIFFLGGLIIVTTITLFTRKQKRSEIRCQAFAWQLVFCCFGFFSLFAIPFDIWHFFSGTLDGEWLTEYSPIMEAAGIWVVLATLCFLYERKLVKLEPNPSFKRDA